MATENIKFKLQLYSEYWSRPPIVEIFVNDQPKYMKEITETKDKPAVIEFTTPLEEAPAILKIKRTGKDIRQTVVENGEVVKDQLVCIKGIEIDEIDIASLVFEGTYTPDYPEPWATQQRAKGITLPVSFKEATRLGHNGTWEFKFSSPFYLWLLENLY